MLSGGRRRFTREESPLVFLMRRVARHSTAWTIAGLIVLAAALRLYRIGASGLWSDEAYSVWVASKHSFLDIWYATKALDARPPLYKIDKILWTYGR